MTEFVAGGRRRIDRVLAPEFLAHLDELDLDEIRTRRADASQEEIDLSYARRLLQGRIDILRAEQESRLGRGPFAARPHSDSEIVAALKEVLTDQRSDNARLGRYLGTEPSRVGEHRREAERAVADVAGSDLPAATDAWLAEALNRLVAIEQRVSRSRRRVQEVVDALADEIARRYQRGEVRLDQADVGAVAHEASDRA